MSEPQARSIEPIPPGSRLLHIGIPKSGTTSLQYAAAANRAELLTRGVRYPGHEINHRLAVSSLMARPLGWKGMGASTPAPRVWQSLQAEVESDPERRAFISHEFACESDDEQAGRFVRALGPSRIQIAISLRGFADLLGSSWQQAVKSGDQRTFDRWLKVVLADDAATRSPVFHRRNDQAVLIERWCRLVGPGRVTVVIADKRHPEQLIDAFEDLLALPRGLLDDRPKGGYAANRTLSAPEAELIRRLNQQIRGRAFSWPRYTQLIREGVIARLLERRSPGPDEPRTTLPAWAVEPAQQRARAYTEALIASGCRIVGDPAALCEPARSGPAPDVDQLPMDAAVEALTGLLSATDGMGAFFDDADVDGLQHRQGRAATLISRSERGRRVLQTVRANSDRPMPGLLAAAGYRGFRQLTRRLR